MSAYVLVIEDNLDIRENISEILELAGYDVDGAENGKEGIKSVLKKRPDLIICDVMMPVMDGYQTLYTLSQNEKTRDIPFVFLTAKSEKEDWRKGMNLGADDYLVKPFEEVELLGVVQTRLKKREQLAGIGGDFTEHKLSDLLAQGVNKSYKKKEVIFREGDYAKSIYQLKSGKLRAFKMNEDGKELSTNFFNTGDFFGFSTVMNTSEHTYSVAVLEDCTLLQFSKEVFLSEVFESKELSEIFLKLLSKEVSVKEENLLKLAYNSVRKRVADSLIDLKEKFGEESSKDYTVKMSRDNLASIVGTSPESVIRVLHDLKEEGLITTSGRDIIVLDSDKLGRIIG